MLGAALRGMQRCGAAVSHMGQAVLTCSAIHHPALHTWPTCCGSSPPLLCHSAQISAWAGSRRAPSTLPTTPSVCPSTRAAALPPCWLLGPLQPRAAHSMQTAALRHPCTQLVTEDTTSPPPPQLLPQTFHEILEAKCQAPLTAIETKNAVGAPQRHSAPQLPSHRLHPFCPSHCKHMHREVITSSNNFPSVFMSPIPSANS